MSVKEKIKITIGITCFNSQSTIIRALQSAYDQNWNNKEILVVDDASYDDSTKLIKEFFSGKKNHDYKLFINEKNYGVGYSRQKILENASGDFIAFFDDDDKSLSSRIKLQYEKIREYEKLTNTQNILCYCSGIRQYSSGYTMNLDAIASNGKFINGEDVVDYLLFFKRNKNNFFGTGTPACSLMARKKILLNVGGFDKDLRRVEDIDLAIKVGISGGIFIGTQDRLFVQFSTQSNDKTASKNLLNEQLLVTKNKVYLESKSMFLYALYWPKLRYAHFTKNYWLLIKTFIFLISLNPLKTIQHFSYSASKRLFHEFRIRRKN